VVDPETTNNVIVCIAWWISKTTCTHARARTHMQVCNTYCFSTATVVCKHASVTLHIHCLSCYVCPHVRKSGIHSICSLPLHTNKRLVCLVTPVKMCIKRFSVFTIVEINVINFNIKSIKFKVDKLS
jgi:hypothetical protein